VGNRFSISEMIEHNQTIKLLTMHPLVRNLYKRFLIVGRDYPQGLAHVRMKVKEAIFQNKHINSDLELKRAISRGRYMVRELQSIVKIHKYRTLKRNYDPDPF
jgi:hypothetical protein